MKSPYLSCLTPISNIPENFTPRKKKSKAQITEQQQKTPTSTPMRMPHSKQVQKPQNNDENLRLQQGRRFSAPGPVLGHAAARGAAAQRGVKAEDEGELGHLGEWMVILEGF